MIWSMSQEQKRRNARRISYYAIGWLLPLDESRLQRCTWKTYHTSCSHLLLRVHPLINTEQCHERPAQCLRFLVGRWDSCKHAYHDTCPGASCNTLWAMIKEHFASHRHDHVVKASPGSLEPSRLHPCAPVRTRTWKSF
jgi:hypothetical protein